ncbi:MAG: universal stress protein [Thermoleophilia bacterium]
MNGQTCPFNKIDKILLCTDGSEYSAGAVREAISLAGRCSSELLVLSIVETNVELSALAPEMIEKEELRARGIVDAVKADAEAAGVSCQTIVLEGESPWRLVVEEADRQAAGLIVMGRRGRSAMKKIVVGSVTARVIGHTTHPVLVAPRAATVGCGSVLLATDGSDASFAAARVAVELGKNCGVTPVVISVAGDSSELGQAEANILRVAELAGQLGVAVEAAAAVGKPAEEIVAAVTGKNNIDLVIIGSHGRTGLERLLMGSVAERVIDSVGCAVLVVPRA